MWDGAEKEEDACRLGKRSSPSHSQVGAPTGTCRCGRRGLPQPASFPLSSFFLLPFLPPFLPSAFINSMCRWWKYDKIRVLNLKLLSSKTRNQHIQRTKWYNQIARSETVNVPDPVGLSGNCGHFYLDTSSSCSWFLRRLWFSKFLHTYCSRIKENMATQFTGSILTGSCSKKKNLKGDLIGEHLGNFYMDWELGDSGNCY